MSVGKKYIILILIILVALSYIPFKYFQVTEEIKTNGFRKDAEGYDLLLRACARKDFFSIYFLINNFGFHLNSYAGHSSTPLLEVICNRPSNYLQKFYDKLLINFYLIKRADANQSDYYGLTPVICAIRNDDVFLVNLLIQKGAEINHRAKGNGVPITNAKSVKMVSYLLKQGTLVNSKDENGRSVLWHAVYSGDVNLANFLINNDANTESIARDYKILMNEAVFNDNTEMINFLNKLKSLHK